MRSPWSLLAATFALAACGAQAESAPGRIAIEAKAVPLNPGDPRQTRLGALTYAGGLRLKSDAKGFGGLSGLTVAADGRLTAVSDAGDLLRARFKFDGDGRPAGLTDATLTRLRDEQDRPYAAKRAADAEDLTQLGEGRFAVSFESDHRVMVYGPGAPPRRLGLPPGARLRPNQGFEALTAWTDPSGAQRLVMGSERGDAWSCDFEGEDCRQVLQAERDNPGKAFRLTALSALPDGAMFALYRAATLTGGLRAVIARVQPGASKPVTEVARLAGGVTVDNMEGLAAVPGPNGAARLYVLSDDNFAGWQRTLLLAFDLRP